MSHNTRYGKTTISGSPHPDVPSFFTRFRLLRIHQIEKFLAALREALERRVSIGGSAHQLAKYALSRRRLAGGGLRL